MSSSKKRSSLEDSEEESKRDYSLSLPPEIPSDLRKILEKFVDGLNKVLSKGSVPQRFFVKLFSEEARNLTKELEHYRKCKHQQPHGGQQQQPGGQQQQNQSDGQQQQRQKQKQQSGDQQQKQKPKPKKQKQQPGGHQDIQIHKKPNPPAEPSA